MDGKVFARHRVEDPAFSIAKGDASVTMYRGNFDITDDPHSRVELCEWRHEGDEIVFIDTGKIIARLTISATSFVLTTAAPEFDRIYVRFHAESEEAVWGGGEQLSYLMLNGRRFPMWTSEPGVGRDKSTRLTQIMDVEGMAGGDFWHTNFPQPTFLTSRWLAVHLDNTCYSVLDFNNPEFHEVEIWSCSARFELFSAENPKHLVRNLSDRFGRPQPLPDWAIEGAILGLKAGDRSFERLDAFMQSGAAISALWCEDWAGIRETSFGRRLFWDWHRSGKSEERYSDLKGEIAKLDARGIRFLGYVNPYLAADGYLFTEAQQHGYFCLRTDSDAVYLVDFGEFECGVVDLTNPAACNWFAERVLGQEMLGIGMSGWMADFGEYLPTDLRLSDGGDPMELHNHWPVLWAELNDRAIASRGKGGDATFFMRAGFSGVQAHCPLLWAGDQSVDFSRHDGIGTVITAALSAGLLGSSISHSDCGGYTSLHGNVRTSELMQRWCELSAFSPVMRTHEGNRPDDNLQYDSTDELQECFVRWSRIHAALAPYLKEVCSEGSQTGIPAQRPLFLEYAGWESLFGTQDQFLLGPDLLVAPIIEEGATARDVVFPGDETWRSIWSKEAFSRETRRIEAPIGKPPVFYRRGSNFAQLFDSVGQL